MISDSPDAKPSRGRFGRIAVRYWIIITVVVLAAIFIAQNRDHHPVYVLWVTVEASTWLTLTCVFVAGLVVGLLLRRRRR